MQKKSVTFDDIARYTNFSKTTISRYFNRPDSLTPKNQEIIRQALVELEYKENKVAKILARGKTEFIGIIIPNLALHYFSAILSHILLTYEDYGYKYLVFSGAQSEEIEKQYIEELMSYQIEGLIMMSHSIPSEDLAALSIPVVSIEREDRCISSVNCDNYTGAIQALTLLKEHDCDIFFYVDTPTAESLPAYQRILGFNDFCEQHQLPHKIIVESMGVTGQLMREPMAKLFDTLEKDYPGQRKGIFFSNDSLANCFLNLLIRKYHCLPEEYKLVGFDNSPIAEEAVYSLSTAGQQLDRMAQEAVCLLKQLINEKKAGRTSSPTAPVHKVIPPILYRRETTEGEKLI